MTCGNLYDAGDLDARRCQRARGHIGACGPRERAGGKTVIDDPDAPALPFGCIHADALHDLARAIDKLDQFHYQAGGADVDRPCLRRLESASGVITAHVSTGPSVGGSWERLEYTGGKWVHCA